MDIPDRRSSLGLGQAARIHAGTAAWAADRPGFGGTPLDIHFVGLSHHSAPLEIRERLVFDTEAALTLLEAAGPDLEEGVLLSTCNRTEVYFTSSDPASTARLLGERLASRARMDVGELHPVLARRHGEHAVRHLFRVTAGLDALIVGETQIIAQVKGAYEAAHRAALARHDLSPLFQAALAFAKRVQTETELGRSAVSVGRAAVRLAENMLGDLTGRTVLLLGAGELAELCLTHLRGAGVGDVYVANRSLASARTLAASVGGTALPFADLFSALCKADVVIGSTAAPHAVLDRLTLERAMADREGRPLFLFDLAVPRDFEPEAGRIPGVHLYDIDDLETVAAQGLDGRRRQARMAEGMAREAARLYVANQRARRAVPIIRRIRERAEEVRRGELERALRRLGPPSEHDRIVLEAMTSLIVKKILNDPFQALKQLAQDDREGEFLHTAARLWRLGGEDASPLRHTGDPDR